MSKRLAKSFNCSTEFTLEVLGGKWKTVIMCHLSLGPLRYAELRKLMPTLSDKVLSQRLRELTDAGLITRQKQARPNPMRSPPRVVRSSASSRSSTIGARRMRPHSASASATRCAISSAEHERGE
jgi:DNA-binding HxlR family transcriptional regulator